MSKLILAVTKSIRPDKAVDEADKTIVVESDKIVVFPFGDGSVIHANGWQFFVDAEVAEIAAAMSAVDASSYT